MIPGSTQVTPLQYVLPLAWVTSWSWYITTCNVTLFFLLFRVMPLHCAGILWRKSCELCQNMLGCLYCHCSVAGCPIWCHLSTAVCNSVLCHWIGVYLLLHAPGYGAPVQPWQYNARASCGIAMYLFPIYITWNCVFFNLIRHPLLRSWHCIY